MPFFCYENKDNNIYNNGRSDGTWGYWTSTPNRNNNATVWVVESGSLKSKMSNYSSYGGRPVITISKSLIK